MPSPQPIDLKVRMLRAGLKASDVAALLGVSKATISLTLNAKRQGVTALNHLREIEREIVKRESQAAKKVSRRAK